MDTHYDSLLNEIAKHRKFLEGRKQRVTETIDQAVQEFERALLRNGYSQQDLSAAVRVYREQLPKYELHQIESQLRELDRFEKELESEIFESLKTFSREGLAVYFA